MATGQVLQRDEADSNGTTGDPRQLYYYFGGMRIGDISNDGTSNSDYVQTLAERRVIPGSGAFRLGASGGTQYADFDQSYDPINGLNYDGAATRYTVQAGVSPYVREGGAHGPCPARST
jgi:hypothetical protein